MIDPTSDTRRGGSPSRRADEGPAVAVRRLSVSYETDDGSKLEAVRDVSLDVPAGEFLAIIGPSGCGKSTLLNAISGLAHPERGTVTTFGRTVTRPGDPDVAYMFQEHALLPWKTARVNIALPLMARGSADKDTAIVDEHLRMVGLSEFSDAYPGQLSGGMRQRVQLARTLITKPKLILMDEPFGSLDAITRTRIQQDFLRICEAQDMTVLLVTHDVHEAALLADRIVVLSKRPGEIVLEVDVPFARPREARTLEKQEGYRDLISAVVDALQPPQQTNGDGQ